MSDLLVGNQVRDALEQIRRYFPPTASITFIAMAPHANDGKGANFFLSNEPDMKRLRAFIQAKIDTDEMAAAQPEPLVKLVTQ